MCRRFVEEANLHAGFHVTCGHRVRVTFLCSKRYRCFPGSECHSQHTPKTSQDYAFMPTRWRTRQAGHWNYVALLADGSSDKSWCLRAACDLAVVNTWTGFLSWNVRGRGWERRPGSCSSQVVKLGRDPSRVARVYVAPTNDQTCLISFRSPKCRCWIRKCLRRTPRSHRIPQLENHSARF